MGATVFFASTSELASLTNVFTVDGTPTDPTAVTLAVTAPSGTTTTYTHPADITKTSTGTYTKDIPCSEAGTWSYLWQGTGAASDAQSGTWSVYPTTLGQLYATVEELKSRLGIGVADTVDDFELHHACHTASRWVEEYCDRVFWRTPAGTVRTFVPDDPYLLTLPGDGDLVTVSAVKTDPSGGGTYSTTWTAADYQLLPHNPSAASEARPYTKIRAVGSHTFPAPGCGGVRQDRVQVTGVFGWPAVPMGVRASALIIAAETFKLKDTFAGQGGFGEFGPVVVRRSPQALDYLKPYRRWPVLVS